MTGPARLAAAAAVRWRYWCLLLWATTWAVPTFLRSRSDSGVDEWDTFVFGGRIMLGLRPPAHSFGALHLYAEYPGIQIGPPALLAAGVMSRLTVEHSRALAVAVIVLVGVLVVRASEAIVGARPGRVLALGLLALPAWTVSLVFYSHLDDALALGGAFAALWLMVSRSTWWAAPVLLGTAAAAKPWAAVLLGLVLALPRRDWIRAAGLALIVALLWWLPFLLADDQTLRGLAEFRIPLHDDSVLHLLGMRDPVAGWVRPAQVLLGGLVVSLVTVTGGLPAALLAGVVIRLWLDPATYAYYPAGAVMGAMLYDLSRRGLPIWTASSLLCLYGMLLAPPAAAPGLLLWGTMVLASLVRTVHLRSDAARASVGQ